MLSGLFYGAETWNDVGAQRGLSLQSEKPFLTLANILQFKTILLILKQILKFLTLSILFQLLGFSLLRYSVL